MFNSSGVLFVIMIPQYSNGFEFLKLFSFYYFNSMGEFFFFFFVIAYYLLAFKIISILLSGEAFKNKRESLECFLMNLQFLCDIAMAKCWLNYT